MGIPLLLGHGRPISRKESVSPENISEAPASNVSTTLKSILSANYVHPDVVDAFIAEVGRIDQKGDTDGALDRGGELATAFTLILPDSEFSKKYGDGVLAVRSVLTGLFSQKDGEERKNSILISETNQNENTSAIQNQRPYDGTFQSGVVRVYL